MSMINAQRHDDSKLEFSLLMWLAFGVFFMAIAMTRLVPRSMRPRVGGRSQSAVHEFGPHDFGARGQAGQHRSVLRQILGIFGHDKLLQVF